MDFSYEVSRSLAACQGVILLVDSAQVYILTFHFVDLFILNNYYYIELTCNWSLTIERSYYIHRNLHIHVLWELHFKGINVYSYCMMLSLY